MEVRPVSHVQVRLYYTHAFSTVKRRVLKFIMYIKIVHSFFKIDGTQTCQNRGEARTWKVRN